MKLHLFTKEVQDEWIREGYDSVKITASNNLSNNNEPEPYFLLEPYNNETDTGDGDMVQLIVSPTVEKIVHAKTGKYYQ